jgi:L-rhamnose mutarotase
MQRYAFRMKLHQGREAEYQRRHDEVWPELSAALHAAGVRDYTIWLDRETGSLFALMHLTDEHSLGELPQHPSMKKWWAHMADLMDVNSDNSPVVYPLEQVFHMD